MEFLHSRILWQILVSVAALVCVVTAISWIRATNAMHQAGKARPLPLPLPIFLMLDISAAVMRMTNRDRLPRNMEAGSEKMRFESIITANYIKAFALLMFAFAALMLVF
jgi:hypothetical protein